MIKVKKKFDDNIIKVSMHIQLVVIPRQILQKLVHKSPLYPLLKN